MTQSQQFSNEPSVTIMVVEDEPLVRQVAADILHDAGFRVIEAGTADDALTLLDANPDLRVMITGVRMPGSLDGLALAHFAAERRPGIGIIVTSGHAIPRRGNLPEGAAFLPKPWRSSVLIEQVERLLAASYTSGLRS